MADFDLDALSSRVYTVKIKGRELHASPPTLSQLFKLMELSDAMQHTKSASEQKDKTTQLLELMNQCIPGFMEVDPDTRQILGAMNILIELSKPEDVKTLHQNDVEINAEKKIEPDGSEKLPDSVDSTAATQ